MANSTLMERFTKKISMEPNSGCWLWTGASANFGYGAFNVHGRVTGAHRVSYELFRGAIPKGLTIDHLCRTPCCVNPDHLEAVTHRTNCLRGTSVAANHARKVKCIRGHEFAGENLLVYHKGIRHERICRQCAKDRVKERKANFLPGQHGLVLHN